MRRRRYNKHTSPYVTGIVIWFILFSIILSPLYYYLTFPLTILILLSINLATFLLYGLDKLLASINTQRIPEKILFATALFGGSAGALSGMYLFRHKTRKTSFQLILALLILVQIVFVIKIFEINL